jgi:cardiolipin synthase
MTDEGTVAESSRVLTIPNVLSMVRLAGVPVFVYLLLGPRADGWALLLLVLSGATDWLDGKLARVLNQSSKLGALLDPLVDRLYVVATLLTFAARGIVPWWVALVLIGRDLILGLTMFVYKRRGLPPPDVIYLGKAATFVLMAALPLLLLAEGDWFLAGAVDPLAHALLVWGTALYIWTGVLYLWQAIRVAGTDVPVRR